MSQAPLPGASPSRTSSSPFDGALTGSRRLVGIALATVRSLGAKRTLARGVVGHAEVSLDQLPPRYRDGGAVSSAPMGNPADLVYDGDGAVAWDRIWGDFCDLALAGGPPHRKTLLKAPRTVSPDDADAQAAVLDELERGLTMTTGWPTTRTVPPGHVGLVCPDDVAAMWMALAIRAENVDVVRDGATLTLPAGPAFQLRGEIKNVVTAVAKAHHYWVEHDGVIDAGPG